MSESLPSDLQHAAQEELDNLSLAISSPQALARAFGYWLRQRMPERLAESIWVDMEGNRDKGISVRIWEKPLPRWPKLKAQFGALLGVKTYGFDIAMEVYETEKGAHVALGLGAVAPFQDYKNFVPVAVLAVRF